MNIFQCGNPEPDNCLEQRFVADLAYIIDRIGIEVDLEKKPTAKFSMANEFTIRFTIKTINGFEPLCDFYLGNDPVMALSVFSQLEGNDEISETDILQADLVESHDGLPFDVKIKHCTLAQMGRGCCVIAMEIFKHRNLGKGG